MWGGQSWPRLAFQASLLGGWSRVLPKFPEEARRAKAAFYIGLYLEIDENGNPVDVRPLGPVVPRTETESAALSVIVPHALEALKQWRFAPAERNGKPIRSAASAQFNFIQRVGLSTPKVADLGADFVAEIKP
ncbi:MAG: energy transducer TonB [Acidobacteria bacterium]|nr:energy transducer TonB [Acidobacteriota bacterium]